MHKLPERGARESNDSYSNIILDQTCETHVVREKRLERLMKT